MANMEPIKVKHWWVYAREHPNFTGCLIDKNNNIVWYKKGKMHREDGPSIEHTDGYKVWYKNGKKHREDGPAVEYADGIKSWWLNDKQYSEQEWLIAMRKIKLEKVLKKING